uniref:Uncharacterized protein n=1 Tax=Anguilla anguilla TaxID=7936 RepID=A0A0E9TGY2_ANGAN
MPICSESGPRFNVSSERSCSNIRSASSSTNARSHCLRQGYLSVSTLESLRGEKRSPCSCTKTISELICTGMFHLSGSTL